MIKVLPGCITGPFGQSVTTVPRVFMLLNQLLKYLVAGDRYRLSPPTENKAIFVFKI